MFFTDRKTIIQAPIYHFNDLGQQGTVPFQKRGKKRWGNFEETTRLLKLAEKNDHYKAGIDIIDIVNDVNGYQKRGKI